ncbi:catalytic beta propeller domain of endosialidase [Escherichia phage vB_EcoP_C]|uniref:Catalytic beta propeller domain of endosialidase n=3 Tax=Vectrevirus sp. 'cee' TaxID=2733585 RepID=A0A1Q1PVC0_9CAUD|nr:tail spike protein [Escherichia phage vB_EcoP_C]AQN31649.1 catalytic beta propeller domain of endosialidase [Escherichia phage vB_EcoP_C]AQN31738.1 catalytic beta propeller domain of endosialidase [Escherichia phage vB_EcoP_D]AQN32042.1 catalytic beta propeller domain of endosialidase [Escherichia phage vB_EcoP_R]
MIQRLGSSLVKFKSKIAGAIWRNLDDKLTEVVSLKDFGAKGDGKTNDQDAVNAAMASGKRIDGAGATYKVSSLPDMERFYNTRFVWERLAGQPLYYVSKGFINGELYKITDNPYYNAWPQDKAFVYENVIYAPYMGSDRHGVSRLHVSWVKSGDDGQTWSTPEWLTDLHPDYPTVNYHCMSMGVCRNRLFAMIETRTLAKNALTNCALWDRPMSRSLHLTGGITKAANQRYATIHVPDHGLFVGDFVNFSNSAVTGVSGDMKVATVIDKDNFTVLTPNQQTSDLNNAGKSWHMGTSFHKSPWRKTDLGLIPRVTEVHSFATIDNNGFVMGYHQGDVAPREVGLFYFPDAFNSPSNYVRRQIPSEYEPDAAEPCIKYYDGVLYLITRGTRGDRLGSSLHRSRDIGQTWESLRFPHNVHHTTLPFAKVGDDLIMFGSERAENEWEAGAPDDRYKASYPRTFYARLNVNKWNADDIEWVNITDQIYQGDIVNSSVGVGSVVVKDSYIYYIFGGENHFNPMTYGDNKDKDPFKGHGHPTDIYCYKMQIANDNRVSRKFTYGATPGQAIPTFMGTDGIRTIPAPLHLSGEVVAADMTVEHLTLKASTSANIRSEMLMEGEYGFIGKTIPTDNPTAQRVIISGGEGTAADTGAQITLHGAGSSTSRRAVYNANEHLFKSGAIMPYNDNVYPAGGPRNRFTTIHLTSDPIITSDATHKYGSQGIDESVLKAWGKVSFKQYKLIGEMSRGVHHTHFGVLAQDIVAAFASEGLDAIDFGIVSFEEGQFGVRYSEILILEAAYTRYRLDKLEDMYATNKIS